LQVKSERKVKLEDFAIVTGKNITPMASVRLRINVNVYYFRFILQQDLNLVSNLHSEKPVMNYVLATLTQLNEGGK
jgi:hypothetical protein